MKAQVTETTSRQGEAHKTATSAHRPQAAAGPQAASRDHDSLLALQRLAGNAAVGSLLAQGGEDGSRQFGGGSTVYLAQEMMAAAPPAEASAAGHAPPVQRLGAGTPVVQRLSDKDTADLDQAGLLIARAVGGVGQATSALNAYAASAPNLLTQLRDNFDAGVQLYKQAKDKVNYIIDEAKEIAEIQDKVLKMVIDAATDGLTSRITVVERDFPGIEGLSLKDFKEQLMGDELMQPLSQQLSQAIEAATAPPTPAAAPALAGADELEFEKRFTSLQARAMQFLPVANLAAQVSQPIGAVDDAVKNARELGQTRHDLPVAKVLADARTLADLAMQLASTAPAIARATKELQDVLTIARAIAPVDENDAEKQLWINWAGSLDQSNYGAVDLDVIEDYLKRKGIWDQLGIDPGMWFSDKEQAMAVCSAFAQTKISASRGTTVTLTLFAGNPERVSLPGITPTLPARMTSDSKGVDFGRDTHVEAVVMGGTAIKEADTGVLSQTAGTKEAVAEYLLSHDYVAVTLKGLRELGAGEVPT